MPDVEKVIKGLECCTTAIGCYECPYAVGEKATDACNLLIDRDALSLLKAQEPVVMAGAELTDAELIEEIRKAPIVLKPNVDAIPVEWLREKMRGYASSLKSTETAALVMVMQMWQKEQEAQK